MSEKLLKYELSQEAVNFLLNALQKVQVSGVQTAESLVAVNKLLRTPANAEDLEKETLEKLKEKYEKPSKK